MAVERASIVNLEGLLTAIVGGVVSISILSVILAPNSPAAGVLNAAGSSFGTLITASKAYPK